jgi:gluconolactonase
VIDVLDDRLLDLLQPDVELELLGSGFTFTEGPIWVPDGQYLLFSDVPTSRRLRWDEGGEIREVAAATSLGNGMTLDREGRLVVCEGETRRVVRMNARGDGGGHSVVAAHYRGRRLNSPNDVVVRSDGVLYFTDSCWPILLGRAREQELDFQGIFRIADGEEPELLIDDMDFPNGLCFSPDETRLYVNDSTPGRIRVLDVAPDGSISNDRIVADGMRDETGHVDGMKCDEHGNVWVTGPAESGFSIPAARRSESSPRLRERATCTGAARTGAGSSSLARPRSTGSVRTSQGGASRSCIDPMSLAVE